MKYMPSKKPDTFRKVYTIALLTAIFSGNASIAYGHGGGLAKDGCHNDRATNSRHCHVTSSQTPSKSESHSKFIPNTKPCSTSQYNRKDWKYSGISFTTKVGYYSGQECAGIDADHVVSLKDAHASGGCTWSKEQKAHFANDINNLVPSCSRINRSKGSSLPTRFIELASDGKGTEFQFIPARQCKYLSLYTQVKKKYGLSFQTNNLAALAACDITL